MYLRTRYTFTDGFRKLEVVTDVDLWRGGRAEPVLSNVYRYESAAVGNGERDSIRKWAEKSGMLYRRAIREGIGETLRMLRLDVQGAAGEILDRRPGRVISRNQEGRLVSAAQ
jgi:hypothetical protein